MSSLFTHIKNRYKKITRNLKKQKKIYCYLLKTYRHKDKPVESDYIKELGVHLFYWKYFDCFKEQNEKFEENLGDYLSKIVVLYMLTKNNIKTMVQSQKTLYAIGSILGMRCQDAVVWGSGILNTSKHRLLNIRFSALDILSVRGPKTRQELLKLGKDCPAVYGDPAILMPKVFLPKEKVKKHKITLVLHYTDKDMIMPENTNINILNILTKDYESFITEICQSELVISSSLHGIILAETYGVPAVLLLPEGACTFKYEDWYNSTDRYNIVIAHSIEEAISIKPMDLPNLSKMQNNLINTFPLYLWE